MIEYWHSMPGDYFFFDVITLAATYLPQVLWLYLVAGWRLTVGVYNAMMTGLGRAFHFLDDAVSGVEGPTKVLYVEPESAWVLRVGLGRRGLLWAVSKGLRGF
ncbi:hypothetical protein Tco_1172048 [Tanacetum coccineum]